MLALTSTCFGQTLLMDASNDSSKKKRNPWQTQLNFSSSTSAASPKDYNDYIDTSVSANIRYNYNGIVTSAFLSASKSLKGARRSRFSTAFLQTSSRLSLLSSDIVTTLGRVRLTLPVNVDRRRENTFRGSGNIALTSIFSPHFLKARSLTFIYSGSYTKNSHRWDITRSFARNTSQSFTNFIALSYQHAPNLIFDGSFSNTTRFDYRNNKMDDVYSFGQSFTYLYSKTSSLTLGHTTGGLSYGYTGNELDIDIFSTKTSNFYLNLGFIF